MRYSKLNRMMNRFGSFRSHRYDLPSAVTLKIMALAIGALMPVSPLDAQTAQTSTVRPNLQKKTGKDLLSVLNEGGMYRHNDSYLLLSSGIGDLCEMNYVDGFMLGPQFTWGHITDGGGRWEIEPMFRYAFGRKACVGEASIRYHEPLEYQTVYEIYGGKSSHDFDSNPYMSQLQQGMAAALFGWNHFKLYDLTHVGAKTSFFVSKGLRLSFDAEWQRRTLMVNARKTSFFGAKAQSNVPYHYEHTQAMSSADAWLEDSFLNYPRHERMLLSARLDFMPQSVLYIYDDMTAKEESQYPCFSLLYKVGMGTTLHSFFNDAPYYHQLETQVSQCYKQKGQQFRYMVGAGCFINAQSASTYLQDYKHFDASKFYWQQSDELHFALLDNYELSTDNRWLEAHAEYMNNRLLLNRLLQWSDMDEGVHLHFLKVHGAKSYAEAGYAIRFFETLKVGVNCNSWGGKFRDWGIQVIFNLQEAREKNK